MSEKTIIEQLRDKIADLTEQLNKSVMEKGLAAEDNKDLRENYAYDYWEQQENLLKARINQTALEIKEKSRGVLKNLKPINKSKEIKKEENPFKPHQWL